MYVWTVLAFLDKSLRKKEERKFIPARVVASPQLRILRQLANCMFADPPQGIFDGTFGPKGIFQYASTCLHQSLTHCLWNFFFGSAPPCMEHGGQNKCGEEIPHRGSHYIKPDKTDLGIGPAITIAISLLYSSLAHVCLLLLTTFGIFTVGEAVRST